MILKYYGEFPDIKKATDYYKDIFDAKVIKGKDGGHHGLVRLFGQIDLLLCKESYSKEKAGYHIIKFGDNEVKEFKKQIKRIKANKNVEIEFDLTDGGWKTTSFFQFKDKYGYKWVLEINSSVIK